MIIRRIFLVVVSALVITACARTTPTPEPTPSPVPTAILTAEQNYSRQMQSAITKLDAWLSGPLADWDTLMLSNASGSFTYSEMLVAAITLVQLGYQALRMAQRASQDSGPTGNAENYRGWF